MRKLFLMLTLFIVAAFCLPLAFAQYEPHTQIGLPKGAIARFGKGYIWGITYSPDSTQVAVATSIGVWIYDAHTGEELNLITGKHGKPFVSAAYSPDGKIIVTGGDGTVQLWNTRTGKNIKSFTWKEEYIGYIKYSPDGKTLATKSKNRTIKLWNARTGKHLKTLSGHEKPDTLYEGHPDVSIASFAYSPDGKTIVSGGGDKTVRLWNTNTGENILTLTGHTETVVAVAYSPDGDTIVSASRDKTVRLWDTNTGENIKTLIGHKDIIVSVAYSPDGNTIISGGWDGMLHRWNAQTGEPLKTYEIYTGVLYFVRGHAGAITHTTYSPDGKTIATADAGTMQWWDAHTGERLKTFTGYNSHSVKYSPDGKTLAILMGKEVQLRDASTGEYLKTLKAHRYNIERIVFSPEGNIIAITTVVGTLGLWDASTGKRIRMLIRNVDTENFDPRASHFPVFSPDGKMIAIKQGKQTVRIWNTSTGEHLNALTGHESPLSIPVFSPDSKTIVTKTFVRFKKGGTVRLWDVDTGENIMMFSYPDYYPQFVFSPDGKILATNYNDNSVRLWDTTTGENITTLTGHTDAVYTLIFSRDGRILTTSSKDRTVRLWEISTGKNIKTFNAPGGTSIKISHSPENDLLVISANSWEKTVTIWNVNTAERLVTFSKHREGIFKSISQTFSKWLQPRKFRHRRIASIRAIKYSPSGDTLMVVMDNEMLRLWNARTTKPIGKPIDPVKDDHKGSFVVAIYSPDGKTFATVPASHAGNVRLWDAATGKYLITLRGHTNANGYAVAFSPDSRKFATEYMDGTVILWNIPTR